MADYRSLSLMGFPEDDWEMITAAQGPNSPEALEALEKLFTTYHQPIVRYFRARVKPIEDAEDLAQEFLLKLLKQLKANQLSSRQEQDSFRAWLGYSLNHHLQRYENEKIKARRGNTEHLSLECLDKTDLAHLTAPPHQDEAVDLELARQVTRAALVELPWKMKGHSLWYFLKELVDKMEGRSRDLTADMVAEELGVSVNVVRLRRWRARQQFQKCLREQFVARLGSDKDIKYFMSLLASEGLRGEKVQPSIRWHSQQELVEESGAEQGSFEHWHPHPFPAETFVKGRQQPSISHEATDAEIRAERAVKEAAPTVLDFVRFSAFSPQIVQLDSYFILEVWAYLESQRGEVLARAARRTGAVERAEAGPVRLARGTELTFHLCLPDFETFESSLKIYWTGTPANVGFRVRVPQGLKEESYWGHISVTCNGVPIATLHFDVRVGSAKQNELQESHEKRVRSIFASYATEDRPEVVTWARGAKVVGVDVFMDVLSLREGQNWERELWDQVPSKDMFCLFWSEPASYSDWVKKEWKCALAARGLDYIHPVPLADPRDVPPPLELAASKHFHDMLWVLHVYERHRREL